MVGVGRTQSLADDTFGQFECLLSLHWTLHGKDVKELVDRLRVHPS